MSKIKNLLGPMILDAQVEARKEENYGTEDLCGMIKKLEQHTDGTLCLNMRNKDVPSLKTLNGVRNMKAEISHLRQVESGRTLLWISLLIYQRHQLISIRRIQAARDRQKSYTDRRRKPLEFKVGDKILAEVGTLAYRIKLPEQLSRVHSTFHVSNLKKCPVDEPLAIPLDVIQIDDKLNFIEEPVEIMDREVKRLKQSCILIVKFRWNSRRGPEFTWEREDQMKKSTLIFSLTLRPRLKL
ncbi:hypothetical protein Tco_0575518 [Tanacetum coccineum]